QERIVRSLPGHDGAHPGPRRQIPLEDGSSAGTGTGRSSARAAYLAAEAQAAADVLFGRERRAADGQAQGSEGRPQRTMPVRIGEEVQEVPRRGGMTTRPSSGWRAGGGRRATVASAALLFVAVCATAADRFASARARMIREIEGDVAFTSEDIGKKTLDPHVMRAMATVPRHLFVPSPLQGVAYENRPLPIGYGQTISQPYIVALMTDLLRIGSDDTVLEVGTGSGYQAAVLSRLVQKVYTMEIVEPLAKQASARLRQLGYQNV